MTNDERNAIRMKEFILSAGYRAEVQEHRGVVLVMAKDDAGHTRAVKSLSEFEALVELAEQLGFELRE